MAIPFVQRQHMPWHVHRPYPYPKDPEDDGHVSVERRNREEAHLEQAEEGEKNPGSVAEQDGEGLDSCFLVIGAILLATNPSASVA